MAADTVPAEPDDFVRSPVLDEITLCATPTELRLVATFLIDCAAEMERMGDTYSHVHLSDRIREFESSAQFVVCPAEPV